MRRTSTENATTAGGLLLRVRPRFFDQVGHETMYALMRDDPEDPERDDISRLEEMKSRELILIIA